MPSNHDGKPSTDVVSLRELKSSWRHEGARLQLKLQLLRSAWGVLRKHFFTAMATRRYPRTAAAAASVCIEP